MSGVTYACQHQSLVEEALARGRQQGEKEVREREREVEVFQFSDLVTSSPGEGEGAGAGLWESKTDPPAARWMEAATETKTKTEEGKKEEGEKEEEGKKEGEKEEEAVVVIPGKCFFADGSVYVGELDILRRTMHGRGEAAVAVAVM